MLAHIQSAKHKPSPVPTDGNAPPTSKFRHDPPPFLIHYKNYNNDKNLKYKVGDETDHDGTTFYFCDCTLHRNKMKWHTYHPDKCHLRNKWLKEKDAPPTIDNDASNNLSKENDAYNGTLSTTEDACNSSTTTTNSDVQALLASVLNLCADNDVVKDMISDALNASSDI